MIRSTLVLASVGLSLLVLGPVAGCGSAPAVPATPTAPAPGGEAAPKAGATNVKEPGDAKVGDTAKCPVSGEEFTVEATSPSVQHDGKTYFFCCGGCKKKFESDPAKYTKKS